jgi:BirA family biotin operon repressor/biotin-[acetyl-CoA-carboxylase] ligase
VSVFASLPSEFADPIVRAGSRLGRFGNHILWYAEVSSTNDVAAVLAERGAEEGTVVIADMQTAGRGRHGRAWASPVGAGLYLSAVLRPRETALPLLTLATGLAVAEAVHAATGLDPSVKWPNDIYLGARKVAGILAEAGSSAAVIQHVVLGIGINVGAAAYPPDVAARATSLESELGRMVDRGLLAAECLAALAARYGSLQQGDTAVVIDAWRQRAASTFGRTVEWETEGICHRGVAEGIDGDGALLVRTESGPERVISGQVRWN